MAGRVRGGVWVAGSGFIGEYRAKGGVKVGGLPKTKLGGAASSLAYLAPLRKLLLVKIAPVRAKGSFIHVTFDPALLPAEWRILKNRPFLGSICQQNIRSKQRPRIQELGNLYTADTPRPEEGWAFDAPPLSYLPKCSLRPSLTRRSWDSGNPKWGDGELPQGRPPEAAGLVEASKGGNRMLGGGNSLAETWRLSSVLGLAPPQP